MSNIIISNLLVVIIGMVSLSACAGGEVNNKNKYFILHVKEDVEEARVCDLYVRDNSKLITFEIEGLEGSYKNKSLAGLEKYLNNNKLQEYEKYLSTCTTYFRFENEPNYFREAHSNLLLIIAIVEITVSTKKFNDAIFELIGVFKGSVIGIMESERVAMKVK